MGSEEHLVRMMIAAAKPLLFAEAQETVLSTNSTVDEEEDMSYEEHLRRLYFEQYLFDHHFLQNVGEDEVDGNFTDNEDYSL